MINNKEVEDKVKEALLKRALGYEYEEKEILADKSGKTGKVKITKKHIPADLTAISLVITKIQNGKW